jgi:hypothetical protein
MSKSSILAKADSTKEKRTSNMMARHYLKKAKKINNRRKNRVFEHVVGDTPKGTYERRIIFFDNSGSHEHYLHATKGWRSRRVT